MVSREQSVDCVVTRHDSSTCALAFVRSNYSEGPRRRYLSVFENHVDTTWWEASPRLIDRKMLRPDERMLRRMFVCLA